jgi:hypothetical protein
MHGYGSRGDLLSDSSRSRTGGQLPRLKEFLDWQLDIFANLPEQER